MYFREDDERVSPIVLYAEMCIMTDARIETMTDTSVLQPHRCSIVHNNTNAVVIDYFAIFCGETMCCHDLKHVK